MGLTMNTAGWTAVDPAIAEAKQKGGLITALAGNPNVGKSTLFNALTGMHQHTGNWSGKTVECARGSFLHRGREVVTVDLPGCYSLIPRSAEEGAARDFLLTGEAEQIAVVCDAACLERNLVLALQMIECRGGCILCVNLIDEAERRGITVDTDRLSALLGVPVIPMAARSGRGLDDFRDALLSDPVQSRLRIPYPEYAEEVIRILSPELTEFCAERGIGVRWLALRLAEEDPAAAALLPEEIRENVRDALRQVRTYLAVNGIDRRELCDGAASAIVHEAERIAARVVCRPADSDRRDRKIDRILTGKRTAFPLMLLFLGGILWLTVSGANYPSALLSRGFSAAERWLYAGGLRLGLPTAVCEALFHGMFRTLGWVVAVMLPPMAIFFPLFTLLEDAGILPRIAFNLDGAFSRCHACGKQALTMCMGLGCNAAGVVGCRIIDSPRERLIAVLTNTLVPCNGRFPGLITLISVFFVTGCTGLSAGLGAAGLLTLALLLGVGMTLFCSWLLSVTALRGVPSSFALELPPYRPPQIGRVLVRSILDRTLFVLSRAAAVAAPAGLLLWLLSNLQVGDGTLLSYCTGFLDPFARLFGLDGVILTAFLLGFPANEIVLPIMLMAYTSTGTLTALTDPAALREIFVGNGWTALTALNVMLFSLFHFPCSTTLLTIRKETGSLRWTLTAFLLPTALGLALCFLTTCAARLI